MKNQAECLYKPACAGVLDCLYCHSYTIKPALLERQSQAPIKYLSKKVVRKMQDILINTKMRAPGAL